MFIHAWLVSPRVTFSRCVRAGAGAGAAFLLKAKCCPIARVGHTVYVRRLSLDTWVASTS